MFTHVPPRHLHLADHRQPAARMTTWPNLQLASFCHLGETWSIFWKGLWCHRLPLTFGSIVSFQLEFPLGDAGSATVTSFTDVAGGSAASPTSLGLPTFSWFLDKQLLSYSSPLPPEKQAGRGTEHGWEPCARLEMSNRTCAPWARGAAGICSVCVTSHGWLWIRAKTRNGVILPRKALPSTLTRIFAEIPQLPLSVSLGLIALPAMKSDAWERRRRSVNLKTQHR